MKGTEVKKSMWHRAQPGDDLGTQSSATSNRPGMLSRPLTRVLGSKMADSPLPPLPTSVTPPQQQLGSKRGSEAISPRE